MKEFDLPITEIFSGLSPARIQRKQKAQLIKCHNLNPVDGDYVLHADITDLNATGVSWGGLGIRLDDQWIDHGVDGFTDNTSDNFNDD